MTRRWREAFGVGDHRRLTCLSFGLELPSAGDYERARQQRATFDESFLAGNGEVTMGEYKIFACEHCSDGKHREGERCPLAPRCEHCNRLAPLWGGGSYVATYGHEPQTWSCDDCIHGTRQSEGLAMVAP